MRASRPATSSAQVGSLPSPIGPLVIITYADRHGFVFMLEERRALPEHPRLMGGADTTRLFAEGLLSRDFLGRFAVGQMPAVRRDGRDGKPLTAAFSRSQTQITTSLIILCHIYSVKTCCTDVAFQCLIPSQDPVGSSP